MPKLRPGDPVLKKHARQMRKVPTLSESLRWHELRGRKFGEIKFRRQHKITPFIVDFYCAEHRLLIEVDGDVHEQDAVQQYDRSRQATLESQGYKVIRFSVEEVMRGMDSVLQKIREECGILLE